MNVDEVVMFFAIYAIPAVIVIVGIGVPLWRMAGCITKIERHLDPAPEKK